MKRLASIISTVGILTRSLLKTGFIFLFILVAVFVLFVGVCLVHDVMADPPPPPSTSDYPNVIEVKSTAEPKDFECPYSHFNDEDKCFTCHGKGYDFKKIKETDPSEMFNWPRDFEVINGEGFFLLDSSIGWTSTGEKLRDVLRYCDNHDITKLTIELQSPGGSLFEGWRVKSLIEEWPGHVTTKVASFAGSAAFIIFCAGDERLINPTAELMQHELWTFKWLDVSTPADKEDEARVLRHIQDTVTSWLATRADLTKAELDKKIRKKEYWVNGAQAVKFGWATGFTVPITEEHKQILEEQCKQF